MHLAANQLLQNDLCCLLHAFSWQQKTHSKEDPFPRKLWERNPINFSGSTTCQLLYYVEGPFGIGPSTLQHAYRPNTTNSVFLLGFFSSVLCITCNFPVEKKLWQNVHFVMINGQGLILDPAMCAAALLLYRPITSDKIMPSKYNFLLI